MSILDQYLKKLGVSSYLDLNDEEKVTFKAWEVALAGRKLTDDDVAQFLEQEQEKVIQKLTTQRLSDHDDMFLKTELHFIRKLQIFLNTPKVEKAFVEQQIKQQLL